jgi:hypothetical protein
MTSESYRDPGIEALLNRARPVPNQADPYRRHHPGARRHHSSVSTAEAQDKGQVRWLYISQPSSLGSMPLLLAIFLVWPCSPLTTATTAASVAVATAFHP